MSLVLVITANDGRLDTLCAQPCDQMAGSHPSELPAGPSALVVVTGQRFLGSRAARLWRRWESRAVGVGGRVGPRGGMVALAPPLVRAPGRTRAWG